MGGGFGPESGAGLEVALGGFAVGASELQFGVAEDVDDAGGVRMHGRDCAGFDVHGEDADLIVFEQDGVGVGCYFHDVLGGSGARGDEED